MSGIVEPESRKKTLAYDTLVVEWVGGTLRLVARMDVIDMIHMRHHPTLSDIIAFEFD